MTGDETEAIWQHLVAATCLIKTPVFFALDPMRMTEWVKLRGMEHDGKGEEWGIHFKLQ